MKLKFDRNSIAALLAVIPADKPSSKIHLVKDDGIYIMSFDAPMDPAPVGGAPRRVVAYARGYNPTTDGDIWDKCRDAVGDDDIGEVVGTRQEFADILADSEGDIIVNITSAIISTSYRPKMNEAQKAARVKVLADWLAKVRAPGAPHQSLWSPKMKRMVKKYEKELETLTPCAAVA